MKITLIIVAFFSINGVFSQTITETVDFINGKLASGRYEIEVSKSGILTIHSFGDSSPSTQWLNSLSVDEREKELAKIVQYHFIYYLDLKNVKITLNIGDGKKTGDAIWFECYNEGQCVRLTFVHQHNRKEFRKGAPILPTHDKEKLYKAFVHLQKLYKEKKEPF